jgi:hypothetical protein
MTIMDRLSATLAAVLQIGFTLAVFGGVIIAVAPTLA